MTNSYLKYWVLAVFAIVLTIWLFMIVPTAIEANNVYRMTQELEKLDEQIERNSNRRLELEKEKEWLAGRSKLLRAEKEKLQNKLLWVPEQEEIKEEAPTPSFQ